MRNFFVNNIYFLSETSKYVTLLSESRLQGTFAAMEKIQLAINCADLCMAKTAGEKNATFILLYRMRT